jgi:hypothetical protein
LKKTNLNVEINGKSDNDTVQSNNTTTVEETTAIYENTDDLANKKQKLSHENTVKIEFDESARKYIDWIDNIERILVEKPSSQLQPDERDEIIQVNIQNLFYLFLYLLL